MLATLDVESVSEEFVNQDVPIPLLSMTAQYTGYHPGIVDQWMRWATQPISKESKYTAEEAAGIMPGSAPGGAGVLSYDETMEEDGLNIHGEADNAATRNAKALKQWHDAKGKPLSATDVNFMRTQQELFSQAKLNATAPIVGDMSGEERQAYVQSAMSSLRPASKGYADVNMNTVLHRVGSCIKAIKDCYDR